MIIEQIAPVPKLLLALIGPKKPVLDDLLMYPKLTSPQNQQWLSSHLVIKMEGTKASSSLWDVKSGPAPASIFTTVLVSTVVL